MSEAIYNKVQLGRQSVIGTGVAATTVFPVDVGFLGFDLDRASETPDEDYGRAARNHAGRSSTGVRWATASLPFVMRFQDFFHILEMHAAGSVSPSGSGPYVYTYTMDATSDTLKPYTLQYGDENSTQDEHRAIGVTCSGLQFGFDALTTPGNAMWKATADLVALSREPSAMTGSLSAPATNETMEGHLTTIAAGSTSTAFASLTALSASLKSYSGDSNINAIGRAYGGATDIATAMGRSAHAEGGFESLIKISSGNKAEFEDMYEVSGALPTERRHRITITGSGNNVMLIDYRTVLRAVPLGESDGERLYSVKGDYVDDSTLGGHLRVTLTNDIASVP